MSGKGRKTRIALLVGSIIGLTSTGQALAAHGPGDSIRTLAAEARISMRAETIRALHETARNSTLTGVSVLQEETFRVSTAKEQVQGTDTDVALNLVIKAIQATGGRGAYRLLATPTAGKDVIAD